MKLTALLIATLTLVLTGLTLTTSTAVADDVSIAATNCNHYSGGGILPRSATYIRDEGDGAATGAAQLCRSGSTYWGYAVLYAPMQSTSWGQAYIWQYRNGKIIGSASCDTPPQGRPSGGNGHIDQNQTQCWTHKFFNAGPTDTFRACGTVYFGHYPDRSNQDSWGCTATVH